LSSPYVKRIGQFDIMLQRYQKKKALQIFLYQFYFSFILSTQIH